MDIDLKDYENLMLPKKKAYLKAAELLGLHFDETSSDFEDVVNDYIDRNYQWYRNDEEYQYMGYDCGGCYMGGDVKKGILCGDFMVIYAVCPNYRQLSVLKRNKEAAS